MYWTFTLHVNGLDLPPERVILMLAGGAGNLAPAFVRNTSRSSEITQHTFDRQVSELSSGFRTIRQELMQLTLRVPSSATTRPPCKKPPRGGRVTVA